jgi:BirA family biotin operon repressor/biotin-[acetyl-CoA-carboxylase] ligase
MELPCVFTVAMAQRQRHAEEGGWTRTWLSADGGLYFTVVLRPDIPLALSGLVNMAAAIDMANVLQSLYGIDARVKWPNDILVDGQKNLRNSVPNGSRGRSRRSSMNIGIGLNVNNRPEIEEPVAVSIKSLLGKTVPRREILEAFLTSFEKRISAFEPSAIIEQWRSRNSTLGQKVRVVTLRDEVEGAAIDIDNQGGLIVQTEDGIQKTVMYGDCFDIG